MSAVAGQLELVPQRYPPKGQLLKWIGGKQRSAAAIASFLPTSFGRYIEPFVGGGAVLGAIAPERGLACDILEPLVDLWKLVQDSPGDLAAQYRRLWTAYRDDRATIYRETLARYNATPNASDLLFLCRTCYGGVVRFTKKGTMSTPLGPHLAIPPESMARRISDWRPRIEHTAFIHSSFEDTMSEARNNDVIYCDPPYVYAQAILYGAQSFDLEKLWRAIEVAQRKGAKVALSLDGYKRSGDLQLLLNVPDGLFAREVILHKGGSMLKRFQRRDSDVKDEHVGDRLLLTW